jgi:AbiV family abortive infection protein
MTGMAQDRANLAALAGKAAQNARDLLAEAEILLDRGRWARAFALSVLAFEEFGKGSAAVALAALPAEMGAQLPVHDLQARHGPKLSSAYGVSAMFGPPAQMREALSAMEDLARDANEAKVRGFYVDLRDDGSVRQPSDEVTEARGQVARVREVLDVPGPLNTAGFLEWLADLPAGLAAEARQFFGAFERSLSQAYARGGKDAAIGVAQPVQAVTKLGARTAVATAVSWVAKMSDMGEG